MGTHPRQVRRTHQLLRDALVALILERGYDNISVQDIADRATLGRATFYLHFHDKYDLLITCLREMIDDLERQNTFEMERYGKVDNSHILNSFNHAAQYKDLYLALLRTQAASNILDELREFIAGEVEKHLEVLLRGKTSPVPLELLSFQVAGSLLAMIQWWLEKGLPYPPESMARLFHEMYVPGIHNVLNLPSPLLSSP